METPEQLGKSYPSVIWQRFVNWIFFPILAPILVLVMRVYAGYRIKNLGKVRAQYRTFCKERGDFPLLVCPNHLTMIDSVVLEWAMANPFWFWLNFKQFPWNIPAIENFKTNIVSRTITYLGKCIPIDRKGSKEHIDLVMDQVRFLLRKGDAFLIFPEGTRSRTGFVEVDQITYGVGKIVQDLGKTAVLCVYLRGDSQKTYSNFPAKKEQFYIDMELIWPTSEAKGIRGQKEISLQVGNKLKELENKYLEIEK